MPTLVYPNNTGDAVGISIVEHLAGLDRIGFADATDEWSRSGVRAEGRNARSPDCSVHDV